MDSLRIRGGLCTGLPLFLWLLALAPVPASGDEHGHGGAAPGGVTSLDVDADGPRVHLLLARRTSTGSVELQHRRSEDGGESWSEPVRVGAGQPAPDRAHRGMDIQLAASGDRLIAAWQTSGTGAFGGGPMATALSADGGATWRPGPNPADDGSTEGHGFIDVAADAGGTFHLVWLDSRGGRQGLRYARSTDGGGSWSPNRTLDDETCECCWNVVATGPGGAVAVLYRDKDPRDMALVRSADGGATWTAPLVVGEFAWDIQGCPHVGGGLAVVPGAGHPAIHSAVWTGRAGSTGVYYLGSRDGGRTLGEPTRLGDPNAWHPDLAAADSGRVAAVWDARGEEARGIYGAVSEDGGKAWSAPRRLDRDVPGVTASHPRVVATPRGFRAFWTEKADGKEATWESRPLDASPGATASARDAAVAECLARVEEVHGAAGPWAVVGYRIGERALKELGLPRRSFRIRAIHRSPAEVPYSCVADGLQAATGASPGKLNLTLETVPIERLSTIVEDRESGRRLVFTPRPEFARSLTDLPRERLAAGGRRVAALLDEDIFTVIEEQVPVAK